jgi:hypothetical protein
MVNMATPRITHWEHFLSRPFRRRGEVEAELLLLGEADEVPLVGEGAPVVDGQMVEA